MKIKRFRVTNYRNIQDSGWINLDEVTAFVGQNEAGKSNLFEALYGLNPLDGTARYHPDEDWPVDDWRGRAEAAGKLVCLAEFELTQDEIAELYGFARPQEPGDDYRTEQETGEFEAVSSQPLPESLLIGAYRHYGHSTGFYVQGGEEGDLDDGAVGAWAKSRVPRFVYVRDYEISGAQVELDELRQRWDHVGRENRHALSHDDQTILVILDLAGVDLDDFLEKGDSAAGRTIRSFDKRAASAYLTAQFQKLWSQKAVKFDIEVDGATLNIFAEDVDVGMPVRLERRSSGFRWYASFAWKFTHASAGAYADCVLLLEEPGIHLHPSGQRDLLAVFDGLAEANTILYTTHLPSMIDLASPERVRIVESNNHHLAVRESVVSIQPAPMAVIEASLGLSPDLSAMFASRRVLIVAGVTDVLLLGRLSGLLRASGGEGLSDRITLWPADRASRTPLYAAFAIGRRWDAGVLLDGHDEATAAGRKIETIAAQARTEDVATRFRVLMLGEVATLKRSDVAIEDLFPDDFYRDCVNQAYGVAIKPADLLQDGAGMITARTERILQTRHGQAALDRRRVVGEILARSERWAKARDLPGDTAKKAAKLFGAINAAFA